MSAAGIDLRVLTDDELTELQQAAQAERERRDRGVLTEQQIGQLAAQYAGDGNDPAVLVAAIQTATTPAADPTPTPQEEA